MSTAYMQLLIEFPVVKKHILGTSCLKQQTVYMTLGIAPGKMNDQTDECANIGPFMFLKVQLKKGKGTEEGKGCSRTRGSFWKTDVFILDGFYFCVVSFTLIKSQHQSYLSWFLVTIILN